MGAPEVDDWQDVGAPQGGDDWQDVSAPQVAAQAPQMQAQAAPAAPSSLVSPELAAAASQPVEMTSMFGPVNAFAQKYVVPAKEFLQNNVGKPIAQAYMGMAGFDESAPLPGNLTLSGTPEHALTSDALSSYAGDSIRQTPAYQQGHSALVSLLGSEKAANFAHSAADFAGQTPLFMLASGAVPVAAKGAFVAGEVEGFAANAGAPLLGKLASLTIRGGANAAEGALLGGAASALTKGGKVEEGMKAGAAVGAVAPPLLSGAGWLLKRGATTIGRALAVLPEESAQQLALEALHPSVVETSERAPASYAVVSSDASGAPVANIVSVVDGEVSRRTIKLDTPKALGAFEKQRPATVFKAPGSQLPEDETFITRVFGSNGPAVGPQAAVENKGVMELHSLQEVTESDAPRLSPILEAKPQVKADALKSPFQQFGYTAEPPPQTVNGRIPVGAADLGPMELGTQDFMPESAKVIPNRAKQYENYLNGFVENTPLPASTAAIKPPPPPPEAQASAKSIKGFETEKGSTYDIYGNSTRRDKSLHAGHDPNDVGIKDISHRTVYVDPAHAQEIGMWNTASGEGKRLIIQGDEVLLTSINSKTGQRGLDGRFKFVENPSIGASPLELFDPSTSINNGYSGNHPGNRIVKLNEHFALPSLSPPAPEAFEAPVVDPLPGQTPPYTIAKHKETLDLVRQAQNVGALKQLEKMMAAPGVRGEPLADVFLRIRASNNLKSIANDTLAALQAPFKSSSPEVLQQFNKRVNDLVNGTLPLSQWSAENAAKFGAKWEQMKQPFLTALKRRAQLQNEYLKLGGNPANWEAVTGLDADNYAARMYMAKMLPPGKWAEFVKRAPNNLLDNAVNFISDAAKKEGREVPSAEIASSIRRMLNDKDPFASFQSGGFGNLRPFKNLKRISDLPEPLRRLMGEVDNGTFRLAYTIGTQESVVAHMRLMNELAQNQNIWSPIAKGNFTQLPDLPQFGPLRNKYVDPDVAEAVLPLSNVKDQANNVVRALLSHMKGNVIALGGPAPLMHHSKANLFHSLFAGADPFAHPISFGQAMKDAWAMAGKYAKDPNSTEAAPWKRLMELNAIEPGIGHAEIKSSEKRMLEQAWNDVGAKPAADFWDVMSNLKDATLGKYSKLVDAGSHFYDRVNSVFRAASHSEVLKEFGKAIAKGRGPTFEGIKADALGPNILAATGHDQAELLERLAAKRVASSFASFSNLGRVPDALRNGAPGMVNPFMTPVLEEARITAQLARRLQTEPDLKWRLGRAGIITAGSFGILNELRKLNGITDDEVDLAHNGLRRRTEQTRPLLWAASSRDSQGRVQLQDLTNDWLGFHVLRGSPEDAMWKRVLTGVPAMMMSGGNADTYEQGLAKLGLIHAPPDQGPREGESGLLTAMRAANRSGFLGPGYIGKLLDTAQKGGLTGGNPSPFNEQLTPVQMAQNALGTPTPIPVSTQGRMPAVAGATIEDKGKLRELQGALKSAAKAGDKDRMQNVLREMQNVQERMKTRGDALNRVQQGGMKQ